MKGILLFTLLCPVAAGAAITFQTPAVVQAEELDVHGHAAVVVFRADDPWHASIKDAEVERTVRHRFGEANVTVAHLFRHEAQPDLGEEEGRTDWTQLTLTSRPGVGASFVLRAQRIDLYVQQTEATASAIHGDWSTHWAKTEAGWEIRAGAAASETAEPLVSLTQRKPVLLHASGLTSLEWHGAEPACPPGQGCPEPPSEGAVVEFIQHALAAGNLALEGTPLLAAMAGSASLSFVGTARLPLASGDIDCPNCTLTDDALTVRGDIQLGLESMTGDRSTMIQGDLSGSYDARINEAIHARPSATTPVLVATTVGLVIVWRLLAMLISRHILDAPLRNPARRNVYQTIEANPGATLSDLLRNTGLGSGNLRHHLHVLEQAGAVHHWRDGRGIHYAPRDTTQIEAMQNRALDDEGLAHLHQHLVHAEGRAQLEIARWAHGTLGWARSTTQAKLRRLCDLGLVEVRTEGFRRVYQATGQLQQ